MTKLKRLGMCSICGDNPVPLTVDHIPPKVTFPKPPPKNLITVLACARCNNGSSQNDERFSYLLSLLVGQNTPLSKEYFYQTLRKLRKNVKAHKKIIAGSIKANLFTPAGIFVEQGFAYKMDEDDRKIYTDTIIKMVKGLYFFHYKKVLVKDMDVNFEVLPQIGFNPALRNLLHDFKVVEKGGFVYLYGKCNDEHKISIWYFQFYNNHWAACLTYPKGFSELVTTTKDKLRSNIIQ